MRDFLDTKQACQECILNNKNKFDKINCIKNIPLPSREYDIFGDEFGHRWEAEKMKKDVINLVELDIL
jgi:hypothetical protein